MTKTTLTACALALICAVGAVHARTVSATAEGQSRPEACNSAKQAASLKAALVKLGSSKDLRYSSCDCQKVDRIGYSNWVCEVEARFEE